MARQTLQYKESSRGMTFEESGPYAVGHVLERAGAPAEHFNVLADPKAAKQVVDLLATLTKEDLLTK